MQKRLRFIGILICIILSVFFYGIFPISMPEEKITTALTPVRLQLNWVPNPQFAGIYIAQAKGFYRQRGIQLEINPYDEQVAVHEHLYRGRADFGIDGTDQVLQARHQGQDLVAVAAIFRLNPAAFASRKKDAIEHPQDLKGKRIGVLPDNTRTILEALMRAYHIQISDVELIPYGYDLQSLREHRLDVVPIYIFDEPYIFAQQNMDINILLPQDYGIDLYGDALIVSQHLLQKNRELVASFVQASLQGWRYLVQHPKEGLEILPKYLHPDYRDPGYLTFMLKNMLPLVHTGYDTLGWMKLEAWQRAAQILAAQNKIPLLKDQELKAAYTNQFLIE
ncbi:ABC-type nitrate/sulfonate/bicarbonate transport system, substrate-binding protein [Allopseudospirillum japonicum]|uniref:Thiamine pyrimidine synthase n=2 Tax=Allopseudospirillum japonicum TaxID=64971 RepID=A0A1H6Q552_9GAMM|nr:ABC-type nitrate/sulfonate/bicarbonate transport system, substrate-binding protein [Allopseudospirillum japonicum]